jgi:hypothetical protein
MAQWIAAAGLKQQAVEDLDPAASGGLTVTIWSARDRRGAKAARPKAEARL